MGMLSNLFGGGGNAWKEEHWGGQQAVLDHAKKLGYDQVVEFPTVPEGGHADKGTWTAWADDFNAWKRREGWKEVQGSGGGEEGGGGFGGGGGGGGYTTQPSAGYTGSAALDAQTSALMEMINGLSAAIEALSENASPEAKEAVSSAGNGLGQTILSGYEWSSEKKKKSWLTPISVG